MIRGDPVGFPFNFVDFFGCGPAIEWDSLAKCVDQVTGRNLSGFIASLRGVFEYSSRSNQKLFCLRIVREIRLSFLTVTSIQSGDIQ